MRAFTTLTKSLELTTVSAEQVAYLVQYFPIVSDSDKVWTLALFSGKRPKRMVTIKVLRSWAIEVAGLSDWLFEESQRIVGDQAETIAKILSLIHI